MRANLGTPRVVLIGCGPTAPTALDSLADRLSVVGLVRDPDPSAPQAGPVCRRAGQLGAEVSADTSLRGVGQLIDRLRPDAVVVSSYNRVLPARTIALSRFVNVHYALLPRYRGRANVNWAVINGETETGISVHVLAPDLDAGNILFQQAIPIGPADTVTELYDRLNALQRTHLGSAVLAHLRGDEGRPQPEAGASYGCTRLPRDGEIDWAGSTRRAYDLIRALAPPYPGALTYFAAAPLTVWRAEPVADPPRYDGRVPGRVVRVSKALGWVDVLTGDGVLRLHEVQPVGGTRVPAAELLGSVKNTLGLTTLDLLDRVQALEAALAEFRREPGRRVPAGGA